MKTFDELVQSRRSIRKYDVRPVPEEAVRAVLEAGRLAPSARNTQMWRFTVVETPALRAQLPAVCCGQAMVGEAPLTLAVWATEEREMRCGQSAASVDCSIALSFMMLKATELGLGTCWLGAFDADGVKKLLGLPEGAVVVALTPLGYPAETPAARPRVPLGEIADRK